VGPRSERLHHVVGRAASARDVRGGLPRARFQNILRTSSKTRKIKLSLHLDMPSGKRRGLGGTLLPPSNKYVSKHPPTPTLTDASHKHVLGKEHVTVRVGEAKGV
jgi:hypothetical protein